MKKLIVVLGLLTSLLTDAKVYHASSTGNDANDGSPAAPWFSLNRAWQTVQPGDTVLLRGGIYSYPKQLQGYMTGKNGTANSRIYVLAYPGEKPVITPGPTYINNDMHWRGGCYLQGDYITFKGIEFSGFNFNQGQWTWMGFFVFDGNFNVFDQCVFRNNGNGFKIEGKSKGNKVINCDAAFNFDVLSGGQHADGFGANYITVYDPVNPNIFDGCRSWWNGDDGFDGWQGDQGKDMSIFQNCLSWNNGFKPGTFIAAGNGEGFKAGGGGADNSGQLQRIYINDLAFFNSHDGFNQNDMKGKVKVLNCIAYKNGRGGIDFSQLNQAHEIRNSLSFLNDQIQLYITAEVVQSNNAYSGINLQNGPGASVPGWSTIVSAADFLSLDTTGVSGPRQADGSLPIINFMRLANGSDLIDAGMNVGLPYRGNAPDLGAFESGGSIPPPPPNQPPTANAGPDANVILPTSGQLQSTLTGSGSDPDGTIASMEWQKKDQSGQYVTMATGSSATIVFNAAGVYTYQFKVTDNKGAFATDEVSITVTKPAPVFDTTFCQVVWYDKGGTATSCGRKAVKYFVKKPDGLYDDKGVKLDVLFYKKDGEWYSLIKK